MAALATSLALPRWSTQVMRLRRPFRGTLRLAFAAFGAAFLVFAGTVPPSDQVSTLGPGGGLPSAGSRGRIAQRDRSRAQGSYVPGPRGVKRIPGMLAWMADPLDDLDALLARLPPGGAIPLRIEEDRTGRSLVLPDDGALAAVRAVPSLAAEVKRLRRAVKEHEDR